MALTRDGVIVPTTPRVISTLLYLVERAGRTVTRDEMLRALWPGRIVEEANLSQAISAVRKALAGDGTSDDLIVTVPGQGYRFTAKVAARSAAESPPEGGSEPGLPPTATKVVPVREARGGAFWFAGAALAILAVAVCAVGLWRLMRPTPRLSDNRTTVVLADLRNDTGDPVLNRVVPRVLQVDLMQSPFLQVESEAKVAATLELMERPPGAPLTDATAREVCARTNGGAVVEPTVDRLGGAYVVTHPPAHSARGNPR